MLNHAQRDTLYDVQQPVIKKLTESSPVVDKQLLVEPSTQFYLKL